MFFQRGSQNGDIINCNCQGINMEDITMRNCWEQAYHLALWHSGYNVSKEQWHMISALSVHTAVSAEMMNYLPQVVWMTSHIIHHTQWPCKVRPEFTQMFHPKVKHCRFPMVTSQDRMSESNVFCLRMYYRSASEDGASCWQDDIHTESSDTE